MIFWISVFIARIFAKLYCRGVSFNKEILPSKGPYIGVINHSSFMDVFAMSLIVRSHAYTMAKHSLFEVPILKWWLKAVNMFPVIRNASDIEAFNYALNLLKQGNVLFMAPEGTRRRYEGQKLRPRTGFVRLAQIANCPVVPIAIWGTFKILPPGTWFPRPARIAVKVGAPVYIDKMNAKIDDKNFLQKQANKIMNIVHELYDDLNKLFG